MQGECSFVLPGIYTLERYVMTQSTVVSMFKNYFLGGAICFSTVMVEAGELASEPSYWASWLQSQISEQPQIVAARATKGAGLASAQSQRQALYNPELETEYEREGEQNNYRIGFQQTIDWWDKREVKERQSGQVQREAEQSFVYAQQLQTAKALEAIVQWQGAKQRAKLALEQEEQLDTFLSLLHVRQKSGDVGQLDAELAVFSLSKKLSEAAQAQAELRNVEAILTEYLPRWRNVQLQVPDVFWSMQQRFSEQSDEVLLLEHPLLELAKSQWLQLQQQAQLTQRQNKADPTVGVNIGKDGGENVIGMNLSIPLTFRKNITASNQVALQQSMAAEANYYAVKRKQTFSMLAAKQSLMEYEQRYSRWSDLLQTRRHKIDDVLERRWSSGDLSTTEYLQALEQRNAGLVAGIELEEQFQLASINYLFQAGQISNALTTMIQTSSL